MDGWQIGLILVLVVGLAAIVAGALIDRRKTRRAREEMLSPPKRTIPRFDARQPAPAYLSELQARRPLEGADFSLTPAERADLDRRLEAGDAVRVRAGLASTSFVTDPATKRAVLDAPLVVLCDDDVGSIRELLTVMERCALSGRPLVIVAPAVAADVLGTAEVNLIQRKLRIAVVLADDQARVTISELTAAVASTVSDRQAGYFPASHLGTAPCWVSTRDQTWVITRDEDATP